LGSKSDERRTDFETLKAPECALREAEGAGSIPACGASPRKVWNVVPDHHKSVILSETSRAVCEMWSRRTLKPFASPCRPDLFHQRSCRLPQQHREKGSSRLGKVETFGVLRLRSSQSARATPLRMTFPWWFIKGKTLCVNAYGVLPRVVMVLSTSGTGACHFEVPA
jgi:hypothetical protein